MSVMAADISQFRACCKCQSMNTSPVSHGNRKVSVQLVLWCQSVSKSLFNHAVSVRIMPTTMLLTGFGYGLDYVMVLKFHVRFDYS